MMTPKQSLLSHPDLKRDEPLDADEIAELEEQLGGPLPHDIEQLLRCASGYSNATTSVDLTGRIHGQECEPCGLLNTCIPLSKTIEGNFWAVDVLSDGTWSSVFYLSHDPPVYVLQFRSLAEFIDATASGKELVDETLIAAACKTPSVKAADALLSQDPAMAKFAKTVSPDCRVFDLRPGSGNIGFEWDLDSDCVRAGDELIFGLAARAKKKGWFAKLFG